jgi:hypothetical protein
MPKRDQHPPAESSPKRTARKQAVAEGGKTRASQPRAGRSGSDSNAEKKGTPRK